MTECAEMPKCWCGKYTRNITRREPESSVTHVVGLECPEHGAGWQGPWPVCELAGGYFAILPPPDGPGETDDPNEADFRDCDWQGECACERDNKCPIPALLAAVRAADEVCKEVTTRWSVCSPMTRQGKTLGRLLEVALKAVEDSKT